MSILQVAREGTKKTVFTNFPELCRSMNRGQEHVMAFLLAELGTRCGPLDVTLRLRGRCSSRLKAWHVHGQHSFCGHVGLRVGCCCPARIEALPRRRACCRRVCVAMTLCSAACSGNLDGQQRLIVKGRFLPKGFENVIRRYVNECDPAFSSLLSVNSLLPC